MSAHVASESLAVAQAAAITSDRLPAGLTLDPAAPRDARSPSDLTGTRALELEPEWQAAIESATD